MDGHGNVAVDVYFNWNLSIFAVYPDLMHARLGNIKLIPMKTALCGIAAYCIGKKKWPVRSAEKEEISALAVINADNEQALCDPLRFQFHTW